MKITIDPGHTSGTNKGIIKPYNEGDAMMKLGRYLFDALLKYKDVECVLTRSEKENPTVESRGKAAAENGSDMFISLHSNSTKESESAAYVCAFYSVKREESKELCEKLVEGVTQVMSVSTDAWARGALTKKRTVGDDYYGVIRNSVKGKNVKYSFLLEHGFHSNKKECEFLLSDEGLKKIAEREAEIIGEYFSLEKSEFLSDGSNLNNVLEKGTYFFQGLNCKIINGPALETENSGFVLDVIPCFLDGVPFVVQKIVYLFEGREYIRGFYTLNNKFGEERFGWKKR